MGSHGKDLGDFKASHVGGNPWEPKRPLWKMQQILNTVIHHSLLRFEFLLYWWIQFMCFYVSPYNLYRDLTGLSLFVPWGKGGGFPFGGQGILWDGNAWEANGIPWQDAKASHWAPRAPFRKCNKYSTNEFIIHYFDFASSFIDKSINLISLLKNALLILPSSYRDL